MTIKEPTISTIVLELLNSTDDLTLDEINLKLTMLEKKFTRAGLHSSLSQLVNNESLKIFKKKINKKLIITYRKNKSINFF